MAVGPHGERFEPQPEQWKEQAKCQDADPDLFFRIHHGRAGALNVWKVAELKRIREEFCFLCPVQKECYFYAVATSSSGVWGGHLFPESRLTHRTDIMKGWKRVDQMATEYRRSISFKLPNVTSGPTESVKAS